MDRKFPVGKVSKRVLEEIIFPNLGIKNHKVLIGPKYGVDAAVVEIDDTLLVIKEDPTFCPPNWIDYFGWAIVHFCANDIVIFGAHPRWMTISLILPLGTVEGTLRKIWTQIAQEAKKLGISIIGGSTCVSPAVNVPLNGGSTIIGEVHKSRLITPCDAKPGDEVIVTKSPGIDAAASLAIQYPNKVKIMCGESTLNKAKAHMFSMSVVEDALTAIDIGGVTAMHDATEGGLLTGLYEIAYASDAGILVHEDRIKVYPEIETICKVFKIDPLVSITSGTLIICAESGRATQIIQGLQKKHIPASIIGVIQPLKAGRKLIRADGTEKSLKPSLRDPYWRIAFSNV